MTGFADILSIHGLVAAAPPPSRLTTRPSHPPGHPPTLKPIQSSSHPTTAFALLARRGLSEWQHSRLLLIVIIAPAFIFLDMDVVLGKGAPPRPPARRQTRASGPLWPGAPKTPM